MPRTNIKRMGFDDRQKIVKVMNNQAVTAEFNGRTYYFRSKLEYRWAIYLQVLKKQGHIKSWDYETLLFDFQGYGYTTGPFMYRPDFIVAENDGTVVIQECKGYHDAQTNSKLRRAAQHYPQYEYELVLQRIPKRNKTKGAGRRRIADKYCRRIIDASEIFKQIKGLL
jgi:hypothetical protein